MSADVVWDPTLTDDLAKFANHATDGNLRPQKLANQEVVFVAARAIKAGDHLHWPYWEKGYTKTRPDEPWTKFTMVGLQINQGIRDSDLLNATLVASVV